MCGLYLKDDMDTGVLGAGPLTLLEAVRCSASMRRLVRQLILTGVPPVPLINIELVLVRAPKPDSVDMLTYNMIRELYFT